MIGEKLKKIFRREEEDTENLTEEELFARREAQRLKMLQRLQDDSFFGFSKPFFRRPYTPEELEAKKQETVAELKRILAEYEARIEEEERLAAERGPQPEPEKKKRRWWQRG